MRRPTTHPTGLFRCIECRREFGRIQAMSRHVASMHPHLVHDSDPPLVAAEKMFVSEKGHPNPEAGPREQWSPLPGGRLSEARRRGDKIVDPDTRESNSRSHSRSHHRQTT